MECQLQENLQQNLQVQQQNYLPKQKLSKKFNIQDYFPFCKFIISHKQEQFYLYKIWPGQNQFFFNGNLMTGPIKNRPKFIFTIIILLIVDIFYDFFVPSHLHKYSSIIYLITIFLQLQTFIFLILTTFTDPGIIPRKNILEAMGICPDNIIDSTQQGLKYCQTCKIYKSSRTVHCKECDNCVEVFDHHCFFLNNCIAKRNYGYFIIFLFCICAQFASVLFGTIYYMTLNIDQFDFYDENKKMGSVLFIFITLMSIFVSILFIALLSLIIFHIYLIIQGKSTKETLKSLKYESKQKFNLNFCRLDPPLFNPKKLITEEQYILNAI